LTLYIIQNIGINHQISSRIRSFKDTLYEKRYKTKLTLDSFSTDQTVNVKILLYCSFLKNIFKTTGPVYIKKCLNPFAFHLPIQSNDRGCLANSDDSFPEKQLIFLKVMKFGYKTICNMVVLV
jgi:hypothetical protein